MLDGLIPPLLVLGATALLLWARAAAAPRPGYRAAMSQVAVGLAIVLSAFSLELAMGRSLAYRNGPWRLWSGNVASDQNSQQVADPYSFTHLIHGAAFYGLTRAAFPQLPLASRAIMAVAAESAWEVYENTDTVINRYRSATVSLGYYGDSVTNSVGDILACLLGFVLTWRLPTRATLAWVTATELGLAYWIRDNLTLNIIMLIHPIEAIRAWQIGG